MTHPFIHLRTHSKYSIGEGTLYISTNEEKDPNRQTIVKLCKKYCMPACALTDTNLMSGTAEFSDMLPANGIQPIIGLEVSLNHHESTDAKQLRTHQLSRLVLLVQNHAGYLNLVALNSLQYMRNDNSYLGPYVTLSELAGYADGIICLSGAHTGPIGHALLENQDGLAADFARRLLGIFDDRFYMEIQRHGLETEIRTEPAFLKLATDMNIPIVATNDVCFAAPESYEAEDALACVLQQTKIIDPDRPRKNSQQYFKSSEEMAELFSDLPEAFENTANIARRCAFMVNTRSKPLLPKFDDNFESECKMLQDDSRAGLYRRMNENKIAEKDKKQYHEQLEFELDVIIKMGFPGYFLIVADYINWCRKNDILVGPGRGSGAGSLVAWALGITNVNPLEYGLLFERFLNPDRISVPDFDVDFEPDQIPRIMDYLCSKYGTDHICRIITFGSLQARGAIRDIGRVFGMPYSKTDRFAKMIPMDSKNISDAVEKSYEIKKILENDADLKKVVDVSMEIEGAYRNLGQHACGIIIGERPTTQIAPVYRDPSNDMPSCQFDLHYLESVGLVKFDFLGLETLTILKSTIKMIKDNYGVNIDLDLIPLEDPKTFELWRAGKTIGVFQYDGSALPFLRQMKPTTFANIVALNALNRPGPMAYIPQYIARMHGEEPVKYPHPAAEEILQETFGIIVYQEQVMQLSRTLAGFTRGESDTLRKGMGKKIKEVMDKMRIKFIDGCTGQKTLTRDQAEEMFQQFIKFAEYAFNKAHSVAYAIIATQCAYLKAHYPAEFLATSMSSNMNDADQLSLFIDDARNSFDLEIVPPDINNSESLFVVRGGKIIFALAAIKGVGQGATNQIVAERERNGKFKNITDFAKRCAPFVNKRILEAFAKVGAFDSMLQNRAQIFMNTDLIVNFASKSKDADNTLSLFEDTSMNDVAENRLEKNMTHVTPWNFGEQLANEHSVLGFYISAHPMDQYKNLISRAGLTTSATLCKKRDRETVQIAVSVNSFNRRMTRTGKQMCSINASDNHGNIDAVAFGDSAAQIATVLADNPLVILYGRASARDDSMSIFVDSVMPLGQWIAGVAKKLTLDVFAQKTLVDLKKFLDGLRPGNTDVVINIHGKDKTVSIALPRGILLSPTVMQDIGDLGVKVAVE